MFKSIIFGVLSSAILLVFYWLIVTLVSDLNFAREQFAQFWYYILSLAIGFGIQISLYVYLRQNLRNRGGRKVLTVTGASSTVAMVSCCAHYLINILPILGIAGVVSIIAQYQIKLFWVGLAFNLGGIIYIISKLFKLKKQFI